MCRYTCTRVETHLPNGITLYQKWNVIFNWFCYNSILFARTTWISTTMTLSGRFTAFFFFFTVKSNIYLYANEYLHENNINRLKIMGGTYMYTCDTENYRKPTYIDIYIYIYWKYMHQWINILFFSSTTYFLTSVTLECIL